MAKIEEGLSDKIIILDDPSTSFDDNRIFAINSYLLNLSKQIKQLIITSHYGQADASFKKIFSQEDVSFLSISQTNDNTSIITKDDYTIENNDDLEFKKLYKIAYENEHEDVDVLKYKVRIFTEKYLKNRFKIYLFNSEHKTLGSIIEFLKTIPNAITEEQSLLYGSINKFYSPTHHEYVNHNFEEIKLVLLSIFDDMKH